jgi:hypothetical protein
VAGRITFVGDEKCYEILVGNPVRKRPQAAGNIILYCILEKLGYRS